MENTVNKDQYNIARQTSLPAKLSLPNPRKNRNRDDDTIGVYDLRDAGGKLFDGEQAFLRALTSLPTLFRSLWDLRVCMSIYVY